MKLQSLKKDYRLFTNIVVVVSILVSAFTLLNSYKSFYSLSKLKMIQCAKNVDDELNQSLKYIKNVSNLLGKQITDQTKPSKEYIKKVFNNLTPKINQDLQDIFTWTLFDYSDATDHVIVASNKGILKNPIFITNEKRSWITGSRIKPWKLVSSKTDIGLVSGELIIPFGYGLTKKNQVGQDIYFGTLSLGINTRKLTKKLESSIEEDYTAFALLDKDNDLILNSHNLDKKTLEKQLQNFKHLKKQNGFVNIDGKDFYYRYNANYDMSILTTNNNRIFFNQFKTDFIPRLLNTVYLAIFFLVLLYFFRAKLVKPFVSLSQIAQDLSQGKIVKVIPDFDVAEAKFLSKSLEKVREYLRREEEIKNRLEIGKKDAENANHNKTEFLASTAHELKNMLSGIIGLGELAKYNIKKENFTNEEEYRESIGWIKDIVKLGEESSEFVNDILDVNQAQTGDFKIDVAREVDLKSIIIRSINLMKIRAIKEQKNIISNVAKDDSQKFFANDLDPRRIKQVFVNIISNSIKYSRTGQDINISLRIISKEESKKINLDSLAEVNNSQNLDQSKKDLICNIIKKKIDNNDNRILIEISDKGVGMAELELEIAQTKYGTIHNVELQNNKIDSTGLGLPIVKHLIEMQGGIFKIESKKNKGTTVSVIF